MPKQNITIGNVKMNKSNMNLSQTLSEAGRNLGSVPVTGAGIST